MENHRIDEQLKELQKNKAFLFKQAGPNPKYDPKGGTGNPSTNPFAKDTFNLTEQEDCSEKIRNRPKPSHRPPE